MLGRLKTGLNVLKPSVFKPMVTSLMNGTASANSYRLAIETMGVILPNAFVAPIRYFVADETKDVRLRLFYRDALAGGIGVGLFYLVRGLTKKAMTTFTKRPESAVFVAATFAGWVTNVAFQAVGAIKMSEAMSRRSQAKVKRQEAIKNSIPPSDIATLWRLQQVMKKYGVTPPQNINSVLPTQPLVRTPRPPQQYPVQNQFINQNNIGSTIYRP